MLSFLINCQERRIPQLQAVQTGDDAFLKGAKVDALDCLTLANEAGSSKAVNIVLLGRLSHYFDLPEDEGMKSLEANVPAKFLDMNKKAFELGKNHA